MGLARSTYYDEPQGQLIEEARLVERIKEICAEWPSYGYRRVTAELHATGCLVNHKKVMRLMQEQGLTVRPRRRFVATTDSDHDGPIFANLAKDVVPTGPNQLWVADITYIPTAAGFLYLAVVLDAFSRRVVGWAMETHLRTELVLAALEMAIGQRKPSDVIHHSDQGSQYTALAFGGRCREAGVRPSMGSVGDAYDNAMCESFFATLECELLARRRFTSQAEARMAVFSYIEGWYNPARRHSGIGYLSPIAYEMQMLKETETT